MKVFRVKEVYEVTAWTVVFADTREEAIEKLEKEFEDEPDLDGAAYKHKFTDFSTLHQSGEISEEEE